MKRWLWLLTSTLLLSGCVNPINTTSKQAVAKESGRARLLFAGDMMWDRSIREQMNKHGSAYILAPLHDFLNSYDAVIANLEGPITSSTSQSVGSIPGSTANYVFTFDPSITDLLRSENIRIVYLGNNHIGNFGSDGIRQTKENLTKASITYFGATQADDTENYRIVKVKGLRVGLVGYNQFVKGSLNQTLADIKTVKAKCDVVIVYTHWGSEYVTTVLPSLQTTAHQMIDNGADIVIGTHPHVVEPSEEYKGKKIYYSLGNFVFDQYFQPETQKGLLLEVDITGTDQSLETRDYPIKLKLNGQTSF